MQPEYIEYIENILRKSICQSVGRLVVYWVGGSVGTARVGSVIFKWKDI